jgi:hypothetical protein
MIHSMAGASWHVVCAPPLHAQPSASAALDFHMEKGSDQRGRWLHNFLATLLAALPWQQLATKPIASGQPPLLASLTASISGASNRLQTSASVGRPAASSARPRQLRA